MGKICTFFGHRDTFSGNDMRARVRDILVDLIEKEGVDFFLFGSYGRFDDMCAGVTRELKTIYPHIILHLLLPYPTRMKSEGKGAFFCEEDFDEISFFDIDKMYHFKKVIGKRNEFMAKTCDFMVCYVSYPLGGAYKAMKKAIRLKKKIFNLADTSLL
ncbi:MAG: hypothetical protein IJY92_01910 [Alphaproteobacteria bacterium]|nr:hypothetical protein [Alphaproteobacteria bacterium]